MFSKKAVKLADAEWVEKHIRSASATALEDDKWSYTSWRFGVRKRYIPNARLVDDLEECREYADIVDRVNAQASGNALGSSLLLSAIISGGITVAYISGASADDSLVSRLYNWVVENRWSTETTVGFWIGTAILLIPLIFILLVICRSAFGALRVGPIWQRRAAAYEQRLQHLLSITLIGDNPTPDAVTEQSCDAPANRYYLLAGIVLGATFSRRQ